MSVIAQRTATEGAVPAHSPMAATSAAFAALDTEIIEGTAFDVAVADFDDVAQEQLYAFSRHRWPGADYEGVIFKKNGVPVGAAMILIQPLPLGVGGLAVAKWGPMLAKADAPDAVRIYAGMIAFLRAEYADRRGLLLSVLPHASLDAENRDVAYLRDQGFKTGSQLLYPNRYLVNLRLDDDAQRKSFGQKWRYHLKKSEKADLSFRHAGKDGLEAFDHLYQIMTSRKGFEDHSAYAIVDKMAADMPQSLKPEVFFVDHEGETVAGALIFSAGDRAVYLYGATNDKALPLRAGYYMHWQIIRWLRDNSRARWYDLGGTDGSMGLHQFKKGMVGDLGVISPVPPVMTYASSLNARFIGRGAFLARDVLQRVRQEIVWRLKLAPRPDQPRTGL